VTARTVGFRAVEGFKGGQVKLAPVSARVRPGRAPEEFNNRWWRLALGGPWVLGRQEHSSYLLGLHEPGRRALFREHLKLPEEAGFVCCVAKRSEQHPGAMELDLVAFAEEWRVFEGIVGDRHDILPSSLRLEASFEEEIEQLVYVETVMRR
jgi:hypothetical protein